MRYIIIIIIIIIHYYYTLLDVLELKICLLHKIQF